MIKVKRVSDGKVFTYDNYTDEIRRVIIMEYCVRVMLKDGGDLICPKQDIPLEPILDEEQELGELL